MSLDDKLKKILNEQHMYGYDCAIGNPIKNEKSLLINSAVAQIKHAFEKAEYMTPKKFAKITLASAKDENGNLDPELVVEILQEEAI